MFYNLFKAYLESIFRNNFFMARTFFGIDVPLYIAAFIFELKHMRIIGIPIVPNNT